MAFPLLNIDASAAVPVYRQIAEEILRLREEGILKAGERLPPTRELAQTLKVNRNTVVAAYDSLQSSGQVESQTGKGTFLVDPTRATSGSTVNVNEALASPTHHLGEAGLSMAARGAVSGELSAVYRLVLDPRGISFAGSYPDDDLLPVDAFKSALNEVLSEAGPQAIRYANSAGDPNLRAWIANQMQQRGSEILPESIIITHGAQQAIDLTLRALIDPGDAVLVESPTYTGTLGVLRSLSARTIGVPVDEQGLKLAALENAMIRTQPKALYLQPDFHNPTGAVLPIERRKKILELAAKYSCYVIEDDWGSDLSYDGRTLPSMHALQTTEQTIHLGTFSKRLIPGLRVGWLAAPKVLLEPLLLLKQLQDFGNSPLIQAALVRYLETGAFDQHLTRVRQVYRRRGLAMFNAIRKHFPKGTLVREPRGGLFLWVELPREVSVLELFERARRRGVSFSRGALFFPSPKQDNAMRLAFGAHSVNKIEEGVKVLGEEARALLDKTHDQYAIERRESIPIL